MIFVTVGTNEAPFDRLIRAVGTLGRAEPMVVQHGASVVRPPGARCVDYLPFEGVRDHVRDARLVITHAGIGSVLVAVTNGKQPVVVPRLRRFGEAVDDHQLPIARYLCEAGLVRLVEDPARLADALVDPVETCDQPSFGVDTRLAAAVRDYLATVLRGSAVD